MKIGLCGAVVLLVLGGARPGHAACQCACVEGRLQPICESTIDLKPICAPQICQIPPPSIRPLVAPTLPPVGTSSCQPQQVFDPETRTYQWRTLCR